MSLLGYNCTKGLVIRNKLIKKLLKKLSFLLYYFDITCYTDKRQTNYVIK